MNSLRKVQILSILSLFIPLNIYVIGDYLGAGIQFSLFRYQETYLGSFIITFFRDLNYVLNGTITGKTMFSIVTWIIGVLFLLIAIILVFYDNNGKTEVPTAGILICLAAITFLISIIIQYGIFFSGVSGISVPVGIPVLFIMGVWVHSMSRIDTSCSC
jgi:hypothetical protein